MVAREVRGGLDEMPKLQQYEFTQGSSSNMADKERLGEEKKKVSALQIRF